MPNPLVTYVNESVPVELNQQEPPHPVESSYSVPQRIAGFRIAYTLYAFGSWCLGGQNIPDSIERHRTPQKPFAKTSTINGQAPLLGSAAIVRAIPATNSTVVTG